MWRLDPFRGWLAYHLGRLVNRLVAPPAHRCVVCRRAVECSHRCDDPPLYCRRHDPREIEFLASLRRNYELQARSMDDIQGINERALPPRTT